MFEVGFSEIVLILGLALLVLGPEKLPGLAEKVGRWTGRARSMARQLRAQLEQEVTLEEMTKARAAAKPRENDEQSSIASSHAAATDTAAEPTAAGHEREVPPSADVHSTDRPEPKVSQ